MVVVVVVVAPATLNPTRATTGCCFGDVKRLISGSIAHSDMLHKFIPCFHRKFILSSVTR